MPNRLLKEGICTSDAINMLSSDSEVLFYRLLVTADDYGRMDGRVQIVKSQCFPLKDSFTSNKIGDLLSELHDAGLIRQYYVNDKPFYLINKWDQRQRSKSKYPDPPEFDNCESQTDDSKVQTDDGLGLGEGLGLGKGKGKGSGKGCMTVSSDTSPKKEKKETPTSETWEAYSNAYQDRYEVTPVRNATTNAQLLNFVKRIGMEESPHVAAFFVGHNNQFYVKKMHPTGLLLADAEKLRTEWATNRTVTETQARQADKKQATGNVFNKLIQEVQANATN